MKTECLETKRDAAHLGEKGKDRVALIKNIIYPRVGKRHLAARTIKD